MIPNEKTKTLRKEIRAVKAEMKSKGIKRISCFNGGHSAESYRLNARLFHLSTALEKAIEENYTETGI